MRYSNEANWVFLFTSEIMLGTMAIEEEKIIEEKRKDTVAVSQSV